MLENTINKDIRTYMKSADKVKLDAMRMLNSKVKNLKIELKKEDLSDQEIRKLINKQVKQHRESIEQFSAASREDLVLIEREQMEALQQYLPEPLGEEELLDLVNKVIAECGASSIQDMGRVMKNILAEVGTRAEGRKISKIVTEQLNTRSKNEK